MAKTPSPRKPKTTRLRQGSGEAGTKAASPRLPKFIQSVIGAAHDKKATGVVVLDLKKAGARSRIIS